MSKTVMGVWCQRVSKTMTKGITKGMTSWVTSQYGKQVGKLLASSWVMSGELIPCDNWGLSGSEPGGQREDKEKLRKEWGMSQGHHNTLSLWWGFQTHSQKVPYRVGVVAGFIDSFNLCPGRLVVMSHFNLQLRRVVCQGQFGSIPRACQAITGCMVSGLVQERQSFDSYVVSSLLWCSHAQESVELCLHEVIKSGSLLSCLGVSVIKQGSPCLLPSIWAV